MSRLCKRFLTLITILFVTAAAGYAQIPGGIDVQSMNVDELSNEQILQIDSRIRSEGITMAEFERLALQRGAQASQVRRLTERIRQVRLEGDSAEVEERGQLRPVQRDTLDLFGERVERYDRDSIESDSLKVFGSDLFRELSRTFEPAFNIPTPRNYTLGPGDEVVVDIWGASERTYRLTVNPEGVVRIENIGPVYLNGLSIEEAEQRLLNQLGSIYSGLRVSDPEQANTWASVSLGNVRSIQVAVMGEVRQPGTYTVTSLSTVFNALYAAGGPGRNGTFRAIRVIRGNETVAEFDLYDFLIHGDQSNNIRLRDQDILQIDPYKHRVHVWGQTRRHGFFELTEGETLADLVQYAGGFTNQAYRERLTVLRVTPTQQSVTDVMWPEGGDLTMRDGDRLRVGEILERFENLVEIEGAVFRPGEYELTPGLTLSELIRKADGPREDAYPSRGIILRETDDLSLELLAFDLLDVLNNPEQHDIELMRNDQVLIESIFEMREEYTVHIRGAVNDPGEMPWGENMTLEDAIFQAQGFRDDAAAYRIEVARRLTTDREEPQPRINRVADVFRFSVDENLQFSDGESDFRLQPYDQVFVRVMPNYQEQQIVRVEGEVQYPGDYVLENRRARLSDLVEWAGGLSDYAFPEGARLVRQLEDDVVEEIALLDTMVVERVGTTTNVGIHLESVLSEPGTELDIILQEGDRLVVPRELQTVRIEGEVLHPASVRYDDSRSFASYINAAGGTTDNAQRRRAYIVYANGEVDRTRKFLFFRSNPEVRPGATIIIPEKPEQRELTPQERISLASSIASTALVIATLIDRLSR
ncbi:MAG: SLBB domain-containing protein [Balneolaceae bacterium]